MSAIRIRKIDGRSEDLRLPLEELRSQLSPRGDIVSDASRQRTIDVFGEPLTPQQVVARICQDIQQRGIQALLHYNEQLDGAVLTQDELRVPAEELVTAHRQAEVGFLNTVRRVRDNIFQFQEAILHSDVEVRQDNGTLLQQRYLPLERVGLCVPGGAAAYPSTVLMTAVPALAAGVKQLAVVAPPTPFGSYNIDLLATCHELGISEVYRMGGAQAVAALAFGVDGVPAVDKIVGPGNLFVALAKKHVYGEVDIDSIAGPSEVVIVADHTSRPDFIAADLLAQSEHAPGASILVTWNEELWHAIDQHLENQLKKLSRSEAIRQSLENYGALILVKSRQQAGEIANQLAPEHLHLQTENPRELLMQIPHAGAAFLGNYSPVCLGDYVAGPSHVLPTGGTARWASGLSANDFLRTGSVIQYTAQAMQDVAADVQTLADKEGLTAHRASVDVRLQALDSHTPSKD